MSGSPKQQSRIFERSLSTSLNMELREQCKRLVDFPQSGVIPKDHVLRSLDFRYIVHKDYLIFYCIDETQRIVDVLAIFNAKKDYLRVMRKYI